MNFLKDVSLAGAGTDLWTYLRTPREHNLLLWLLACMPVALIILMFQLDSTNKGNLPPPQVTYFESWPADRSIEEIKRDQLVRQAEKEKRLAERRKGLKKLGRAIGMDVDKIEQETKEREAAAKKSEAAQKAAEQGVQK